MRRIVAALGALLLIAAPSVTGQIFPNFRSDPSRSQGYPRETPANSFPFGGYPRESPSVPFPAAQGYPRESPSNPLPYPVQTKTPKPQGYPREAPSNQLTYPERTTTTTTTTTTTQRPTTTTYRTTPKLIGYPRESPSIQFTYPVQTTTTTRPTTTTQRPTTTTYRTTTKLIGYPRESPSIQFTYPVQTTTTTRPTTTTQRPTTTTYRTTPKQIGYPRESPSIQFTYPVQTTTTTRPTTTTRRPTTTTYRTTTTQRPTTTTYRTTTTQRPTTTTYRTTPKLIGYPRESPSIQFTYPVQTTTTTRPTTTTRRPTTTTYRTTTTQRPTTTTYRTTPKLIGYPRESPSIQFTYPVQTTTTTRPTTTTRRPTTTTYRTTTTQRPTTTYRTTTPQQIGYPRVAPSNPLTYPVQTTTTSEPAGYPRESPSNPLIYLSPVETQAYKSQNYQPSRPLNPKTNYQPLFGDPSFFGAASNADQRVQLPPFDARPSGQGSNLLSNGVVPPKASASKHEDEEDGKYHENEDHAHWDIRKSIPGEPGADYPVLHTVPETKFSCDGRWQGYYSDIESGCQVFHVCAFDTPVAKTSFLCPNGSIFNQELLTCDWWSNVDCAASEKYFDRNAEIGKVPTGASTALMMRLPTTKPLRPDGSSQESSSLLFNPPGASSSHQESEIYLPPKERVSTYLPPDPPPPPPSVPEQFYPLPPPAPEKFYPPPAPPAPEQFYPPPSAPEQFYPPPHAAEKIELVTEHPPTPPQVRTYPTTTPPAPTSPSTIYISPPPTTLLPPPDPFVFNNQLAGVTSDSTIPSSLSSQTDSDHEYDDSPSAPSDDDNYDTLEADQLSANKPSPPAPVVPADKTPNQFPQPSTTELPPSADLDIHFPPPSIIELPPFETDPQEFHPPPAQPALPDAGESHPADVSPSVSSHPAPHASASPDAPPEVTITQKPATPSSQSYFDTTRYQPPKAFTIVVPEVEDTSVSSNQGSEPANEPSSLLNLLPSNSPPTPFLTTPPSARPPPPPPRGSLVFPSVHDERPHLESPFFGIRISDTPVYHIPTGRSEAAQVPLKINLLPEPPKEAIGVQPQYQSKAGDAAGDVSSYQRLVYDSSLPEFVQSVGFHLNTDEGRKGLEQAVADGWFSDGAPGLPVPPPPQFVQSHDADAMEGGVHVKRYAADAPDLSLHL